MKIIKPYAEAMSAHRNKHGFRGVEERKSGLFRAALGRRPSSGDGERSKCFLSAEEAARAYDRLARKHYGERAWLNFPNEGERHVTAIEDGFCKRGHPRNSDNSYYSPDGRCNCRPCNALSQARRKARA